MNQKDEYWQGVRGIAALAVVFIHCRNGLGYTDGWQYLWFVERAVVNFPVFLFVFMSGFFVRNTNLCDRAQCLSFYRKKAERILIPYMVWSLLYIVIDIAAGKVSGNASTASEYIVAIFTGGAAPQLYYCIVLLQLIVLTPVLVRFERSGWFTVLLLCISPVYSAMLSLVSLINGAPPPMYSLPFTAWISFYYAGILVRNDVKLNCKIKRLKITPLLGGALLLVGLETVVSCFMKALGIDLGYAVSQNKLSSMCYSALIILIFARGSFPRFVRRFSKVGNNSYALFLSHYVYVYLLKVLDNVWNDWLDGGLFAILPLAQVVEMLIVTSLSYLSIRMIRWFVRDNRLICSWLGL